MVEFTKISKFQAGEVIEGLNRRVINVNVKNVRHTQWVRFDGVVCPANTFTTVGQLRVDVNHALTIGSSGVLGNIDNRGILTGDIRDDTNAVIVGEYQFVPLNSNFRGTAEFTGATYNEVDITELSANKTMYSPAQRVQENDVLVREYGYIALQVRPEAQQTFSESNSSWSVPITDYELK